MKHKCFFLENGSDVPTLIIAIHHSHYIDFIALSHVGYSSDSTLFGDMSTMITFHQEIKLNRVYEMEHAETLIDELKEDNTNGHIKWDGCSNWNFGGYNCAMHLCEAEEMDELSKIIKDCYKYTENNLATWFN